MCQRKFFYQVWELIITLMEKELARNFEVFNLQTQELAGIKLWKCKKCILKEIAIRSSYLIFEKQLWRLNIKWIIKV